MNSIRIDRWIRRSIKKQNHIVTFVVLAILGILGSRFAIQIPGTDLLFEGRWIFGYIGFALLPNWWSAVLLAAIISIGNPVSLPLHVALLGNMAYALPSVFYIRTLHRHLLHPIDHPFVLTVGWFATIVVAYQLFQMPILGGVVNYLTGDEIVSGIIGGWIEQLYFGESIIVAAITALAMTTIRLYRDLHAREQEYATTLYSIGDGVIATDIGGRIRGMNRVAEGLMGWKEGEARGRQLDEVFHIKDEITGQRVDDPVAHILQNGPTVGLANHSVLVSRDGTERPIHDSGAPIYDQHGTKKGVVLVIQDITEEQATLRRLEESNASLQMAISQKDILLRELFHRTKNNMNVIRALLNLSTGNESSSDLLRVVSDVDSKIQTIAIAHDKLYESHDLSLIELSSYLRDIATTTRGITESERSIEIEIVFDLEPFSVSLDSAIPLGLTVNELITNSLRHAFSTKDRGTITLSSRLLSTNPTKLRLEYTDDGIGISGERLQSRPSGIDIITGLIDDQLNGTIEFKPGPGCTVVIEVVDDVETNRLTASTNPSHRCRSR